MSWQSFSLLAPAISIASALVAVLCIYRLQSLLRKFRQTASWVSQERLSVELADVRSVCELLTKQMKRYNGRANNASEKTGSSEPLSKSQLRERLKANMLAGRHPSAGFDFGAEKSTE